MQKQKRYPFVINPKKKNDTKYQCNCTDELNTIVRQRNLTKCFELSEHNQIHRKVESTAHNHTLL